MKFVSILFGSGWWVPWHILIVGSIIPMFLLLRGQRRMNPDEESDRAETLFRALLGVAFTLAAATVIDGAMLGWRLAKLYGAGWGTISGLAFFTLWTVILFGVAKRVSLPKDQEEATMFPATTVLGTWHAGIVVANLIARDRIHG